MKLKTYLALGCATITTLNVAAASKKSEPSKPNIIYILADDLGYGDLSCYGQKHFKTPNIDKLAENGIKFTQHYSGSTVCAPSRSCLMTGQHTGHTPIRGNQEWKPEGQWPMPQKSVTIAEMLKEKGYATGAFGKWGLGYPGSEGDPNNQGFDVFYGYNCQRIGHNYYPWHLWHNQEKVMLKGNEGNNEKEYAPDLIHNQAIKFMVDNKDKPFFLYYPSIIPHAELKVPEKLLAKHRGKYEPEKKYRGCDSGPHYKVGGYGSQKECHATFAAMIDLLDQQVGEIVAKVKELGIEKNTLIIFTSDNGPHLEGGADPDYFDSNGVLKGYKRDLYEGGVRVPMIASWPQHIKKGSESDHISAFWDIYPTVADMLNIKTNKSIDGISILPTLTGKKRQKNHKYLYWEFNRLGGRSAVRMGKWKFVSYNTSKPQKQTFELYNLDVDPGEKNNVYDKYPKIIKKINKIVKKSRTNSDVYKFETPIVIK